MSPIKSMIKRLPLLAGFGLFLLGLGLGNQMKDDQGEEKNLLKRGFLYIPVHGSWLRLGASGPFQILVSLGKHKNPCLVPEKPIRLIRLQYQVVLAIPLTSTPSLSLITEALKTKKGPKLVPQSAAISLPPCHRSQRVFYD
jgi:hypothetical protein